MTQTKEQVQNVPTSAFVNGVPVARCLELVAAVKDAPVAGQTNWKAVTRWNGGLQCETKIRDHVVLMDEPEQLGGTNQGPNMVEAVLAAYSSCLMVGYALNASLRGITIDDLRVEVEGDLDLAGFFGISDDVPAGFSGIRAVVYLSADTGADEVEALHEHVLKTSPVGSILQRPLSVETKLSPA